MPTFSPSAPQSADAATLYHLSVLLSEITAFKSLCEAASTSAALAKIVYGIHATPQGGDEYSETELASVFCEAHLHPGEGGNDIVMLDDGSPTPISGGVFVLDIRRYARPSEIATPALRNNLFLWYFDCVNAIANDLVAGYATRQCPRITKITKPLAAAWGDFSEKPGQGEFLFSRILITWGDLEAE